MQNVIISFETDVQGINVGIEGLLKLGKVVEADVTLFNKFNETLSTTQKLVSSDTSLGKYAQNLQNISKATVTGFGNKAITDFQKVVSTTTDQTDLLNEALTSANNTLNKIGDGSELFQNLAQQIKTAKDYLDQLAQKEQQITKQPVNVNANISSNAEAVVVPVEVNKDDVANIPAEITDEIKSKPITPAIEINEADLQEAIASINNQLSNGKLNASGLSNIVATAKELLPALDQDSIEFKQLTTVIAAADKVLETLPQTQDKIASPNFLSKLRSMRFELQQMEASGQGDTQAFVDLSVAAAKVEQGIQRTQERIRALASETGNIQAVTEGVGALAAGFQVGAGAAALMGTNDDELQKTLVKLNALLAITNGIQQIENAIKEQSILKIKLEAIANGVLQGANKATAATYNLLGIAVEEDTVAFEGLRAVMLTLGIGVIVFAITELASALSNATDNATAFHEIQKKAADNYASELGNLNNLVATIKSEVSTRGEKQDAIDKIKASYPEYLGNLTTENIYSKQTNDLIAQQIDLLQKKALAQASQEVYIDKLKAQAEAQAEYNRVVSEGGSFGEKFVATLKDFNDWFNTLTPQQILENQKLKELSDATKQASDAFGVVNDARDALSKGLQGDISAFQNYINQFNTLSKDFQNISLTPQVKPFNPQQYDDDKNAALAAAQYKVDVAVKGTQQELAAQRALKQVEYTQDLNDERLTDDQKKQSYGKYLGAIHDLDQQAQIRYLNEAIAADKTVQLNLTAQHQELSDAYLQAKRKQLIDEAALEIANAKDNTNQIQLIHAQLNANLNQLDIDFNNKKLAAQKIVQQYLLDIAKVGSQEELNAQISILEIEKQQEINSANGNAVAIQAIKDKYRKKELEEVRAFNIEVAQIQSGTDQAQTNATIYALELSGLKDADAAIIEEKKRLIDEQAQLDIEAEKNSKDIETEKQTRILAIQGKALVDKKALDDAAAQQEIDDALKVEQQLLNIQKSALDNLSNVIASYGPARKALDDASTQNALANIQAEKDAFDKKLADKLISQTDYNQKIIDLDNQTTQVQIENAEKVAQRKEALFDAAADYISGIFTSITQNEEKELQTQAQNNQDLLNNKLITQNEYNKRQAQLKRQEAALNKEQAIFDIFIEAAKKIFQIETTAAVLAANPATALLAPIALREIPTVLIEEAIALAFVAARKFKHGKIKIDGPGTQTSDSILAGLSRDESVVNAKATTGTTMFSPGGNSSIRIKHIELLEALNSFKLNDYLSNLIPSVDIKPFSKGLNSFDFNVPYMLDIPTWYAENNITNNFHIDYKQLAKEIAAEVTKSQGKISDIPQAGLSFDENGVKRWIKKGDQLDIYLNKKHNYKRG